jgi:UDP-N-acetylglucosamine pyrophosphorylase
MFERKIDMDGRVEEIRSTLKKYGQEHLLNHYETLDEKKKKELLNQMESIDFELINSLYNKTKKEEKHEEDEITPMEYLDKYKLYDDYKYYENIGKKSIKEGKLAAVTMAGGQGTRLGHNGPKGTYDIGLDSHKSLFELLSDNLKEEGKKYGVTIPWFIMTSKENNKATVEFFEKNKYFGYQKDKNIFFFIQGELPMIDTEGKILVGEDGLIKQAADGHGGIYESLVKNGMTQKMKQMGIEWVFIGGVDNCLVKMVDPVLMGVAIDKGVTVACKSVVKLNPQEKVGVFCKRNGKPNVIEYSEITEEMAEARDENGELLYGESHILCNLFSVDAVERMGANPLPYHVAYKKATYIDKDGNLVVPDSPNAYKFEAFLFDAFGEVDDMAILRVKREEEFAPVKNADSAGVDCPKTARELYRNFYHLN